MTPEEQQAFAQGFFELYLSMGLGSLPKREIDLYVFHHLIQSTEYRSKSNYELANAFGVPESRIKTLRLNAAIRHQTINPHAVLSRIVDRLIHSQQFAELTDGKLELSLEDPVEKRELVNFLKTRGHHAEYTLNSEVLKITPMRLFELIITHVENADAELDQIIQAHIIDHAASARILADAPTLKQKLDRLRAEHLNLTTLKSLIGVAFDVLISRSA